MEDWMNFHFSMEDCFSPDSWSSGSSPEGSLPLADIISWAENALHNDTSNSSPATEEEQVLAVPKNEDGNTGLILHAPFTAPETAEKPKRKDRVVFSERQLHILNLRFSLQTHLKPDEMEELAEMTGLTYKQVKTWFQNTRARFRRRDKERKDCPLHGPLSNIPPHVPHLQGDGQTPPREQCNQPGMDTNCVHSQGLYLASLGNGVVPAGPPSWTPSTSRSAVPSLPQTVGSSVPQTFPPSCLRNPKCDEEG